MKLTDYPADLKSLNKALKEHVPGVRVRKGAGYYYIGSDDPAMSLKIAGLYTSSIYVYRVTEMPIGNWIEAVKRLLSEATEKNEFSAND